MAHSVRLKLLLAILDFHKVIHLIGLIEILHPHSLITQIIVLSSHHSIDILSIGLSESGIAFLCELGLLLDSI